MEHLRGREPFVIDWLRVARVFLYCASDQQDLTPISGTATLPYCSRAAAILDHERNTQQTRHRISVDEHPVLKRQAGWPAAHARMQSMRQEESGSLGSERGPEMLMVNSIAAKSECQWRYHTGDGGQRARPLSSTPCHCSWASNRTAGRKFCTKPSRLSIVGGVRW